MEKFPASRDEISTEPISGGCGGRRGPEAGLLNQKASHCLCPILGSKVSEPCWLAVSQGSRAGCSWSSASVGAHVEIKAGSCLCCIRDRLHVSHLGYVPCQFQQAGRSQGWPGFCFPQRGKRTDGCLSNHAHGGDT